MQQIIQNSIKFIKDIDFKKHGWIFTTASITALIFYQKAKENNRKQKPIKKKKQNETSPKVQNDNKQLEQKQFEKKNICIQLEEKQEKIKEQEKQNDQVNITTLKQHKNDKQTNMNHAQINLQNLKDYKKQQFQLNLKKQISEQDKKSKKSNINSSNNSILRSSQGKYTNKLVYDEEITFYQPPQQYLPLSDIESRQNQQIRNQMFLKKQRKYITDIDEPLNSYKRNQIQKLAKEQSPNDGFFFQVLATLAENEEEQ